MAADFLTLCNTLAHEVRLRNCDVERTAGVAQGFAVVAYVSTRKLSRLLRGAGVASILRKTSAGRNFLSLSDLPDFTAH